MGAGHEGRAHALLSCSGADRWMHCTPSARLEERFDEKRSEFAAEGTLAHELAELHIRHFLKEFTKRKLNSEVKKLMKNELFSSEMPGYVEKYVEYVKELHGLAKAEGSVEHRVEARLSLDDYIKDGFGSVDDLIVSPKTLRVIDLKYGRGIQVSAIENSQLKLYALGALCEYGWFNDFEKIEMHIVQPRLHHVSVFEMTPAELEDWGEKNVKPLAALAFKGEGLQKAGSWCRFCKAKPRCGTAASANMKPAVSAEFKAPHFLTDAQMSEVAHTLDQITSWAESVKKYMLSEALNGRVFEGFKVVEGSSRKVWKDAEKAAEVFAEKYTDVYNYKLKSITDISKLAKDAGDSVADIVSPHVVKPKGGPVLALLDDPRPAYAECTAAEDFKNI